MSVIGPFKARLLETHRIRWEPGFSDPSAIGWLATAGYAAAAILAWGAAARARRAGLGFERVFWLAVCAAMAFLALNKQLDLQVLLTEVGRQWAVENDWYQQRRSLQKAFMAVALLVAGIAGILAWWATRGRDPALRLAVGGMAVCGAYIIVRAASFHHTDVLMHTDLIGLTAAKAIEFAGMALTAAAAWRYRALRR